MEWEAPPKQGLYDPQNEHEACGVGFVVAIDGKRSHKVIKQTNQPFPNRFTYKFKFSYLFQIVRDAETLALRMEHRGACACDNDTGDGAGVLTAIPHVLYSDELRFVKIA